MHGMSIARLKNKIVYNNIFFFFSASMWMEHPSESSRISSPSAFPTRKTDRCEYTRAFGTRKIGRQEADLWRQIGAKHLSLLPTGASMPIRLVSGLLAPLLAAQTLTRTPTIQALSCSHKNWTPQANKGSNGCRRITWFTIIARTQNDSHKAFLQNARQPKNPRVEVLLIFNSIIICTHKTFSRAIFFFSFVFLNFVC